MRIFYFLLISSLFFQTGCAGEKENEDKAGNELEQLDELMESVQNEPEEEVLGWRKYFDLKVPSRMNEMTELNQDAIAQFGYVDQVENANGELEVLEHYLIVMMENKSEIEGYPLELEVDVMSYRDDAMRSLKQGDRIVSFDILNEPVVETVNEIKCVKNQMDAVLEGYEGPIGLYYQLGVYESDKAFYQVLTWCISSQKDEFEKDMERVLNSFREK